MEVGMQMRGRSLMLRRALVMSVLGLAASLAVAIPASAERARPSETTGVEQHCVAAAVGQTADGELLLSEETCYDTFAEVMSDLSAGTVKLDVETPAAAVFNDELIGTLASSFTLGIHYDGYGGSGSSISITGSSCSGGYWNAYGFWSNRISSSFNGCYHLRHYDYYNRSGSSYNTYTSGQIDNIYGWMNNRTNSVAYYSS
jgi:hypothetical protein